MPSMSYILSIIGEEPFSITHAQKVWVDQEILKGQTWLVFPNGRSFARHSVKSIKPKYSLTQFVRDLGGTKEEYIKLAAQTSNQKLLT